MPIFFTFSLFTISLDSHYYFYHNFLFYVINSDICAYK